MKNWLKRLFCNHIFKIVNEEGLSIHAKYFQGYEIGTPREEVALYKQCIKCGKERIERCFRDYFGDVAELKKRKIK